MRKRYSMELSMFIPAREKDLIVHMSKTRRIHTAELLRRCAVYDYEDRTARIRGDDCYKLGIVMQSAANAVSAINEDVKANGCGNSILEAAASFQQEMQDLLRLSGKVYKSTEKIRIRIRKQSMEKMMESQKAFLTVPVSSGKSTLKIKLTDEEYDILKKKSEEAGLSPAIYIRRSVFERCLVAGLYVDSYPLDGLINDIAAQEAMLHAIAADLHGRTPTDADMGNIASLILNIRESLEGYSVPAGQKETRREVERLTTIDEK